METNGPQDVSDITPLLQTNLILSYGQQEVCEFNYHFLARWSKGKQAVSNNALVVYLIHITYCGQQAVSDTAPALSVLSHSTMTNRKWVTLFNLLIGRGVLVHVRMWVTIHLVFHGSFITTCHYMETGGKFIVHSFPSHLTHLIK